MSASSDRAHDPSDPNDALVEPLPWISRERAGGAYRLPGLRYPLGALIYGVVLIALSILAITATAGNGALAAGIPICLIAAGLGIWMILIAAIRWPWYRAYVQRHGHSPF